MDDDALAGTLVFVRSSLTGDEPPDVRNYAATDPRFPHHPTLPDQWFDEVQFESYRALGEHLAASVFGEAAAEFDVEQLTPADHVPQVRRFFANVRNRWFPPPPDFTRQHAEAGKTCAELIAALRADPNREGLIGEIYPEVGPGSRWSDLLAVNHILAVMELGWLGVELDGYYSHPMNRGWMGAFRRWTNSATFEKYWPVLRGEYSKDFVRFCEKTLNLPPVRVVPVRAEPATWKSMAKRLNEEFVREWAELLSRLSDREEKMRDPGETPIAPWDLNTLIAKAITDAGTEGNALVWFLNIAESRKLVGEKDELRPAEDLRLLPIGILVVYCTGPKTYETVFWIRGAYRSLGLGRAAIESEVPTPTWRRLYQAIGLELWKRENTDALMGPPQAIRVQVRYPILGETSADRLQRTCGSISFTTTISGESGRSAATSSWFSSTSSTPECWLASRAPDARSVILFRVLDLPESTSWRTNSWCSLGLGRSTGYDENRPSNSTPGIHSKRSLMSPRRGNLLTAIRSPRLSSTSPF